MTVRWMSTHGIGSVSEAALLMACLVVIHVGLGLHFTNGRVAGLTR